MNNHNQITMDDLSPSNEKELAFLTTIKGELCTAIEASGGTPEMLSFRPVKEYTSVFCGSFMVFRVRLRRGQQYISVPLLFKDLIPEEFPRKQLKSEPQFIRLLVGGEYAVEEYSDFLAQITGETINRYPKEWDCCSHYMECSDAKVCTHPDKIFALSCGYRKILNSGRIFYGRNRNID